MRVRGYQWILAALLLLTGKGALAQVLIPDQPADAGPLRINRQKVEVKIRDRVAVTSIEQEFFSTAKAPITATYLFPMPREATVTGFAYWVKGQKVEGKLLGRTEAEKKFTRAAASGRGAALVQEVDKITFQSRITPVLPDTITRVRIDYLQTLPYVRNEVTCLVPLRTLGIEAPLASLEVDVHVEDQLEIARYSSPSHPGAARFQNPGPHGFEASLSQSGGQIAPLFKLSYRLQPKGLGATLSTFRQKGEPGYFLLQLAPTSADTREVTVPRDMIFVFDRSTSMEGEKLAQAKRALALGLEGLRPEDRFNVVTYHGVVEPLFPGLTPHSTEALEQAQAQAQNLECGPGGTNIYEALHVSMRMFEPSSAQRLIVFLTDGLPTVGITDKKKIVADVTAANKHEVRLFAWGFGKDADDQLLAQLATRNHAVAEHYDVGEVIQAKMRAFYQRSGQPILLDPVIEWGTETRDVVPARLPDLYHGVSLAIMGRYEQGSQASIRLRGKRGKSEVVETLNLRLPQEDKTNPHLAQLWARGRAAELVRMIKVNGEQEKLKDDVVELSKRYGILTPYTTYYAEPPKNLARVPVRAEAGSPPATMVGQTQFAVAGDPRIAILAPPETRSVVALLPWGERLDLAQGGETGRWTGRFMVPAGTPHGNYMVRVVLTDGRGRMTVRTVEFSAAVDSPRGQVETGVERVRGGVLVSVTVRVRPGVARVVLVREGQSPLTLKRVAGREYFGQFFLPEGRRSAAVRVVLLDAAHNRTELPVNLGGR